jgi:hypothetical protein
MKIVLLLVLAYLALGWLLERQGHGRAAVGFLVAPLGPALIAALIEGNLLTLLVFAPFSYGFSLLGVPAYFAYRKLGWLRFWSVVPTSAVLGGLAGLLLNAMLEVTDRHNLLLVAGYGTLVGTIFWLVALATQRGSRHASQT